MKTIKIIILIFLLIYTTCAFNTRKDGLKNNSKSLKKGKFSTLKKKIFHLPVSTVPKKSISRFVKRKRRGHKSNKSSKKKVEEKKEKLPKISVIIPTYNSEKFIGRCLESALNQTFKEIEILVVDDFSKDSTVSVIEEYQKEDDRIKTFFQKKNRGVGFSRNLGIDKASGEFIGFIDADDYVDPEWFQYLYENSTDKDLVRGIRVIHNFSDEYNKAPHKPYGCIIPSIIRKSFLVKTKLRFPEVKRLEDSIFNRKLKKLKPRTLKLPDEGIYYHYVKREGSLSHYVNTSKKENKKALNNSESVNANNLFIIISRLILLLLGFCTIFFILVRKKVILLNGDNKNNELSIYENLEDNNYNLSKTEKSDPKEHKSSNERDKLLDETV